MVEPLNVGVDECAAMLGLGKTVTKRLIATGQILSYLEGRRRVVPVSAIREYQEQRVAEARAEMAAETERQHALETIDISRRTRRPA